MLTGEINDICVIDFDFNKKDKDNDGAVAFYNHTLYMCEKENKTPYIITTRSGGKHLYFRYSNVKGIRNRSNAIKGRKDIPVDIRSHNGYVVSPPSVIDGKHYTIAEENKGDIFKIGRAHV